MPQIVTYTYSTDVASQLGEGSFGQVFRGYVTDDISKVVAIKRTLVAENAKCNTAMDVIVDLRSDYIVRVMDVFVEAPYAYVVMELMHGTLEYHIQGLNKISRKVTMSPANLHTVARSIAKGYLHLHERNVMHRDIKPQNVLITYTTPHYDAELREMSEPQIDAVKLSDFGTCRVCEDSYSNLCGTPLYMAPEVGANLMNENEYDSQVDMWSIGCLLYECINGEPPFSESALCHLFLRSATAIVNDYSFYRAPTLRVDVNRPTFYDMLVARLLDANPKTRMDADQFHAACERMSVTKPLTALPTRLLNNPRKLSQSMNDLRFLPDFAAHATKPTHKYGAQHVEIHAAPPHRVNRQISRFLWNVADSVTNYLSLDFSHTTWAKRRSTNIR